MAHHFPDGSILRAFADHNYRMQNSTQGLAPYIFDASVPATGHRYVGVSMEYGRLSPNGPDSSVWRELSTANVTYEKKINRIVDVRAAAAWFRRPNINFNPTQFTQYDVATKLLTRGVPGSNQLISDQGIFNLDVLTQYPIFNGRLQNKTVITIDYSPYYEFRHGWALAAALAANPTFYVRNLNPLAPDYRVPAFDTMAYQATQWRKLRRNAAGTLIRQQVTAIGGRLIGYGGIRYDRINYNFWNQDAVRGVLNYSIDAKSPMVGFNFKATPNVAVYGSWSNSFNPNVASNANATTISPNETGAGWDYGLKCSFLDDRLSFTLGGFYTNRENVLVTELDANGLAQSVAAGHQLARGIEFDAAWRATSTLSFLASYGHVDSKQIKVGRDLDARGRPPAAVPRETMSLAARQSFTGVLKGVSANIGARYKGKSYPGSLAGGLVTNGLIVSHNGMRSIVVSAHAVADLGVRYRIPRTAQGITQTISFNINNLFDREYLLPSRLLGEARTYYFGYEIRH